MPHGPNYHLVDNNFVEKDQGITTPTRAIGITDVPTIQVARTDALLGHRNTVTVATEGIQIMNYSKADPPGYTRDSVPRDDFNGNTDLFISAEPRMPQVRVICQSRGFDHKQVPIFWRLQCRHVACRHSHAYRYRGLCQIWHREWHGRAFNRDFMLFWPSPDPDVTYDYNTNDDNGMVCGGHAILTVAVRSPTSRVVFTDYVHMRFRAENPDRADVLRYVDRVLSGRDLNIIRMVRAIFQHEAGFRQFARGEQVGHSLVFNQRLGHLGDPTQPDCHVQFPCPRDPPGFPLTSFDFGVGIAQFTAFTYRAVTAEQAWDWRENINAGINLFMTRLRSQFARGLTWTAWARTSWAAYNGTGAVAAQYANEVAATSEGQLVQATVVPAGFNLATETAAVPARAAPPPPPAWPPP